MKLATRSQSTKTKASKDVRGTITVRVVKSNKKVAKQIPAGIEAAFSFEDHSCRTLPICNATIQGGHFPKKIIAEPPSVESALRLKANIKYKLQLFPIDDITCNALLQDGHNPHLELTLGERKKISSVVKHLDGKWGRSRVANGELKLFPFNARLENVDNCMSWSLKDVGTNATDVYRLLGNPAMFRLRYGWLPYIQPRTCEAHCNDSHGIPCPEYTENSCTEQISNVCSVGLFSDGHPEVDGTEKELEIDGANDNAFSWSDDLTNISFEDLLDGVTTLDGYQADHLLLENYSSDGLTNISISDLLDEVAMSDDSQVIQLPEGNDPCPSFNALIAAQIAPQQFQTQPAVRLSSILDAEEACQHFPLFEGEVPAPSGEHPASKKDSEAHKSAFVGEGGEYFPDAVDSPLTDDYNMQSSSEDNASADIINDQSLQGLFQILDEDDFSLSEVNWDSLGPFDFSFPAKSFSGGAECIDLSSLLVNS